MSVVKEEDSSPGQRRGEQIVEDEMKNRSRRIEMSGQIKPASGERKVRAGKIWCITSNVQECLELVTEVVPLLCPWQLDDAGTEAEFVIERKKRQTRSVE
jgi:hypothetical protein